MHVADELLRDRARTATVAKNVVFDRAGDSNDVDSVMLVEALVFDCDEGLADIPRKSPDRDVSAYLRPDFTDERAVARKYLRRLGLRHDLPHFARSLRGLSEKRAR